ncbi:MAG: hypothetical protein IPN09_02195 [Bacteroidetes bacterium]|nr:hypothetical protein [Bacteroidota bacterium]
MFIAIWYLQKIEQDSEEVVGKAVKTNSKTKDIVKVGTFKKPIVEFSH